MASSSTIYHGTHEYSTFSASTIQATKPDDDGKQMIFQRCCCFFCRLSSALIFHPVGPFRCCWDMFVMVLIIYTSIEIPFTMSFGQSYTTLYIGLCVDMFLLIDIFLNFHTAYFDKYDSLRLVTNKKYICKKYFRTWFFIDFVTCLPFELVLGDKVENASHAFIYIKILRIFRLLRIIKILRFLKMLRIFDAFMKQFIVREVLVLMKLLKIICGMLMFAHLAACVWWFVGSKTSPSWIDKIDLRGDDIQTFTKYSYSWYWAVVTLFTTGYGDIVATNTTEQWVCSMCILIGTCFFAYFVGTLTVLITEGDKIKSYESDKLEEAQSFCEKKKLPKELTRAILTHIRYHCTYNYVFDESELLNILPSYLQHDIHTYVSQQFLLQLKIFQNEFIHLPEFIIGLIAVKTKSISCNQSYKLYDVGDMAKEFYIQRTGRSIMCDGNGDIIHELCRGSVCGEYSSILFKKRKVKIECETWSEFYSISIDDIRQILDLYYPKSSLSKWKQIKKYLRVSYKKNVLHSVDINTYGPSFAASIPTKINLKAYASNEESVHLFNNTRKKHTYGKFEQFPAIFRPMTMSRVNAPIPPDIDSDDMYGQDLSIRTPSIKIAPKPDTADNDYEYSLPKNVTNHYYHSYANTNTNKNDHNDNTNTVTAAVNTPTIKSTKFSKFSKFQIRSNSEVRDSIVVAHAAKHALSPEILIKSDRTKQGGTGCSQEELATASIIQSIEMGLFNRTNNKFHSNMMSDLDLNRRTTVFPQFDDILDSENSFYSSPSSDVSSGEDRTKQKLTNLRSKSSTKAKLQKKKKGKAGKFGGRGGRSVGKSVANQTQYKHNRHVHHKKHLKVDDIPQLHMAQSIIDSVDEDVLLTPLAPFDVIHNNGMPRTMSIESDIPNIKLSICTNMETIADEEDVINNNVDGNVTPLAVMPDTCTRSDMCGGDAIDAVS